MNEHERINAAVKKYIDGDKKAFTEIYELTYQATYYYVIGTVKNKEAAEDIISDTYLEVVKSIGTLSSPKAFVSWLRTIAHSKICRYFKKNGREVLVTEEEEPIFDTLENENEEFIPAVALEKESDRNEIIRIINGLSDVQKQTVFMHYFDKMPVAKIAEAMECSENTVKSRLNYARKALKDMFVAEEKKGNKFYSVAPFMFMLFSEEVQAVRVSAELSKRIIESAEVGAAATAAGSGIIGTIKGFFSTAAGKFAAASTAAKAGIGVGVAAVVATACIVPAVISDNKSGAEVFEYGEYTFYVVEDYINITDIEVDETDYDWMEERIPDNYTQKVEKLKQLGKEKDIQEKIGSKSNSADSLWINNMFWQMYFPYLKEMDYFEEAFTKLSKANWDNPTGEEMALLKCMVTYNPDSSVVTPDTYFDFLHNTETYIQNISSWDCYTEEIVYELYCYVAFIQRAEKLNDNVMLFYQNIMSSSNSDIAYYMEYIENGYANYCSYYDAVMKLQVPDINYDEIFKE